MTSQRKWKSQLRCFKTFLQTQLLRRNPDHAAPLSAFHNGEQTGFRGWGWNSTSVSDKQGGRCTADEYCFVVLVIKINNLHLIKGIQDEVYLVKHEEGLRRSFRISQTREMKPRDPADVLWLRSELRADTDIENIYTTTETQSTGASPHLFSIKHSALNKDGSEPIAGYCQCLCQRLFCSVFFRVRGSSFCFRSVTGDGKTNPNHQLPLFYTLKNSFLLFPLLVLIFRWPGEWKLSCSVSGWREESLRLLLQCRWSYILDVVVMLQLKRTQHNHYYPETLRWLQHTLYHREEVDQNLCLILKSNIIVWKPPIKN